MRHEVKTVRVAMSHGPVRSIPADVVGALAVHPLICPDGSFHPEKFVITHVPSGLTLGYWFASEKAALACARALVRRCQMSPRLTKPSKRTLRRYTLAMVPILLRRAAGQTTVAF